MDHSVGDVLEGVFLRRSPDVTFLIPKASDVGVEGSDEAEASDVEFPLPNKERSLEVLLDYIRSSIPSL